MIRFHAIRLVLFVLAAATAPSPPSAHAQQPATDAPEGSSKDTAAEARKHFERGVELHAAGDISGTLAEFERAYELRPSPLLSFHIGRVAMELREYARSHRALMRFLAAEPGRVAEPKRAEAQALVGELESRIARLEITTNEAGARISIDDELLGETPLREPIVLDVGSHRVRVSKPGFVPVAREVALAGGTRSTLHFQLEPLEIKSATATPPATMITPPKASPSERDAALGARTKHASPLVWTGFATAGVLAVAGGVTGIYALRVSSEHDRTRYEGASGKDDFDREATHIRRLSITSDVLLVAALVTAGATAIVLWRKRESAQARRPTRVLRAALSPQHIGVEGTF